MTNKKTYTREFKEEAVRLAQQNDNTSETARSLGIHDSILRRWKKEIEDHQEKAFPGKGHAHEEELRQLQRENQRLKETVEIRSRCIQRSRSKKAMGIFTSLPLADPT
jgi:transposase